MAGTVPGPKPVTSGRREASYGMSSPTVDEYATRRVNSKTYYKVYALLYTSIVLLFHSCQRRKALERCIKSDGTQFFRFLSRM